MRARELAKLLGINSRQIAEWKVNGCPNRAGDYNRESVAEWMRDKPRLMHHIPKLLPPTDPPAHLPPTVDPAHGMDDADILTSVVRLRAAEKHWQTVFDSAIANGEPARSEMASRRLNETIEQRRKVEKDAPAIAEARGAAIPVSELTEAWSAIGSAVKNGLLALPSAIAPRLLGKSSEAEIAAILDEAIRDELRHIGEAIPRLVAK